MIFVDPTIINQPPPEGWQNYDLFTEVNESDKKLIEHLENTKWEHFANGGYITGTQQGIDESPKTRWYGLQKLRL